MIVSLCPLGGRPAAGLPVPLARWQVRVLRRWIDEADRDAEIRRRAAGEVRSA
ncbi:hypothetical protein LV457_03030 [Mycobacterium sp. MYCO198283]|uniref:hypothetical protein n=1 Tax=Mycobacterium sp. MYCO198283 TaxID=2883505 RepID=UPI001E3D140A|nr:hypothetical protein [Mycobacterium sp. MYCO198283]MCG5431263.1 hypothetical protein [Mycobacterium sp. MYCO198283]